MSSPLNEATDKAEFLRWICRESLISPLDGAEINRICQQWIKYQIRLWRSASSLPLSDAADDHARSLMEELNRRGNAQDEAEEYLSRALTTYFRKKIILAETARK